MIIAGIEIVLRIIFLIKRRIFPAAEEKLEVQIEEQITEKIKIHTEKIEKKQEGLEQSKIKPKD